MSPYLFELKEFNDFFKLFIATTWLTTDNETERSNEHVLRVTLYDIRALLLTLILRSTARYEKAKHDTQLTIGVNCLIIKEHAKPTWWGLWATVIMCLVQRSVYRLWNFSAPTIYLRSTSPHAFSLYQRHEALDEERKHEFVGRMVGTKISTICKHWFNVIRE